MKTCSIPGCMRRHNARGLCITHYGMWLRHGDPLYADKGFYFGRIGRPHKSIENFWRFVVKREEEYCWEWIGVRDKDGYGIFSYRNKSYRATRFLKGVILREAIEGLFVCHTCDNPGCVNPSHLFVGTAVHNAKDRDEKGRGQRGKKKTPEHARKVGDSRRGIPRTEETKKKLREANLGKKHTPESKAKMSKSRKGVPRSSECIEKTAAAHRGMKRTDESKERMKTAQQARRKEASEIKKKWWSDYRDLIHKQHEILAVSAPICKKVLL